jgi:hypothetical protein
MILVTLPYKQLGHKAFSNWIEGAYTDMRSRFNHCLNSLSLCVPDVTFALRIVIESKFSLLYVNISFHVKIKTSFSTLTLLRTQNKIFMTSVLFKFDI